MGLADLSFWLLAAGLVTAGLLMALSRSPAQGAGWFMLIVMALSGLMALAGAPILAGGVLLLYPLALAALVGLSRLLPDVDLGALGPGLSALPRAQRLAGLGSLVLVLAGFACWALSGGLDLSAAGPVAPLGQATTLFGEPVRRDLFGLSLVILVLIGIAAVAGVVGLCLSQRQYVKRQDVVARIMRDPERLGSTREFGFGRKP